MKQKSISSENWHLAKHIFQKARNLNEDKVDLFIERACKGDIELMQAIRHLIKVDGELKNQTLNFKKGLNDTNSALINNGFKIGKYIIIDHITSGGMGDVYLAERDGSINQQVAIKVLKNRLTLSGLNRFNLERSVLAHLEHPNIARFIDAGEENGIAYYVMEYVHGMPIDSYCEKYQLSVDERLKLFIQVCQVVSYAHMNLIVHRDIKPSNILVTKSGAIKLIDFGVAKLLDNIPTIAGNEETIDGMIAMSPRYASPEQLQQKVIGTTCDVYALGLLLYELLTEKTAQPIMNNSIIDIYDTIIKVMPTIPSKMVLKDPPNKAHFQISSAKQLSNYLKGDLDSIINHAIKKEPNERYQSVNEFQHDINNFLNHQPLQIRNDVLSYKLSKFIRRNWFGLTSALMLLAISTFVVTVIYRQQEEVINEQLKTEDLTQMFIRSFKYADPTNSIKADLKAIDVLDETAKYLKGNQQIQSNNKDDIILSLSKIYNNMSASQKALDLLEANADRFDSLTIKNQATYVSEKAKAMLVLNGGPNEGLAYLDGFKSTKINEHLSYQLTRAKFMNRTKDYLKSEQLLLVMMEQTTPDDELYTDICLDLSVAQSRSYQNEASRQTLIKCIEELEATENPALVWEISKLKEMLIFIMVRFRELEKAEKLTLEEMDYRKHLFGEDHISVADIYSTYSYVIRERGRVGEASKYTGESYRIREQIFGKGHKNLAIPLFNIGSQSFANGDYKKAESQIKEAIEILESYDLEDGSLAYFYLSLGKLYMTTESWDQALSMFEKSLALDLLIHKEDNLNVLIVKLHLGHVYLKKGLNQKAKVLIELVAPVLLNKLTETHPTRAYAFEVQEELEQVLKP